MSLNFILGSALFVFGFMKAVLYFFGKQLTLSRLDALKEKFGEKRGAWIYLLVYAAIPMAVGWLLLFREYRILN